LIELLVESGLNINARDHKYEMNALQILMTLYKGAGTLEVVKLLIEKGINVNETDKDGHNALNSLCLSYKGTHFAELVNILLESGVDIKMTDQRGRSALHCLCDLQNFEDNIFGWDFRKPTRMAERMKILLEIGIEVNSKDNLGRTALHYLSAGGRFHTDDIDREKNKTKFPFKNGANINATNRYRRVAPRSRLSTLDEKINNIITSRSRLSTLGEKITMIQLLIEKGIEVNAKDFEGKDAWHYLKNGYEGDDKTEIENIFINLDHRR